MKPTKFKINIIQFKHQEIRMANILVLDDNETLLEVITDSIEQTEHQVTASKNSYYIDRLLNEQNYELVITDIIMPEKEGIEIIMHIKKHHPETKIIAMTGKKMGDSLDLLDIAENIGANATLAKPFTPRVLLDLIKDILG